MDDRGGTVLRHLARCFTDDLRTDAGLEVDPLRRVLPHVLGELRESVGVALDIVLVVKLLVDQDVHPRQQQCEVGPGLDRQPVVRLGGRYREARVHGNQRGVAVQGLGERLHLCVVQVFADVRAEQNNTARVGHVGTLRRACRFPDCQAEADVAWPTALRERGFGAAVRSIRP